MFGFLALLHSITTQPCTRQERINGDTVCSYLLCRTFEVNRGLLQALRCTEPTENRWQVRCQLSL